jgi:CBS domain containing-hemolysin-like protein
VGTCIIGLVACYLLSSFFSIIKIVFLSIDKNSLPADDERLRYYAAKIESIQEKRTFLNTTVAFGTTLANTTFAMFSFCLATQLLPHLPRYQLLIIAGAFSLVTITVFAYTIPRAVALRFNVRLAPTVLLVYGFFHALFFFFSWCLAALQGGLLKLLRYDERFAFLSQEERSRMSDANGDEEALDEDEKEMIHSIFEFGETTVEEIMVPRVEVKGLDIKTDFDTVLATITEAGHSRIPVYRETVDNIVGVLYAKDVLSWVAENSETGWRLETLLKKPHFVPATKKIDDMMAEFKRKQIHMAIVVDEYGGTAGLVTLEDILEEIVTPMSTWTIWLKSWMSLSIWKRRNTTLSAGLSTTSMVMCRRKTP